MRNLITSVCAACWRYRQAFPSRAPRLSLGQGYASHSDAAEDRRLLRGLHGHVWIDTLDGIPIQPSFEKIDALGDRKALIAYLGSFHRGTGFPVLIGRMVGGKPVS